MTEAMTIDEVMENEKIKAGMDDFVAAMEQDAAMMRVVEAAKSVEDMYEITKRFVKMAFEDFKKLFQQVAHYFSDDKTVLADEMLDSVVGGWSFSGLFDNIGQKLACIAGCVAGVGAFVGGIALGGVLIATANPVGLAAGMAVAGAGIAGGTALLYDSINMLKRL